MRIVLETGDGQRELSVDCGEDTTLGEVLDAVGVPHGDAVGIGDRRVPVDHTVLEAAIVDGATVTLQPPPRAQVVTGSRSPAVARLAVVAGPGAGRAVALDAAVTVGRDEACDLVLPSDTVSREHCRVVPDGRGGATVTDLGTTNGTWVGGEAASRRGTPAPVGTVLRAGAVVLRVEPLDPDDRPRGLDPLRALGSGRAVPFNRPPRPGLPPPPAPVEVPDEAPEDTAAPPFNLVAVLAPLVLGAVLVVVLDSWRYAVFVALSPLMMLANTWSSRRRHGRDSARARRDHRAALERFDRDLAAAAAAERDRRWELLPSVAEHCRRALGPSTRLWERRADHTDALRCCVGVGSAPWSPPLVTAGGRDAPRTGLALRARELHERLPRGPVEVSLADGGVVGIVGERRWAEALARSLVVQCSVAHGPADLRLAVVADRDRVGAWGWTTWLPHALDPTTGSRRLAAGATAGAALLRTLRSAGPSDDAGEVAPLLLVLDAPSHLTGRDADARAVLRGAAGPVAGIVLAPTADQLPAVCDTIVEAEGADGAARLVRPSERLVVEDLVVAGLDVERCRAVARRLAGFEDPEQVGAAGQLPGRVDLLELLPTDVRTEQGVSAAWAATAGAPGLAAPIGVGPDGPVELDLVRDGPHGLLGGTTGSGKSELLRSLVAGLAATHAPDDLTFVLIDYKGGAAFDACGELPHVVGLVTDLDQHLGERALRCLEAELEHRERRLRACGVSDLPAWQRLADTERGPALPRLLVVIDEFATLKAELPAFVEALVGIAQRGRSLGVHLLLGTQRPSGAVDDNVRANANLRVALRMTDDADSLDVVGVRDAATIAPSLPGRGLLRSGPEDPTPVQTALVTGRARAGAAAVRVAPVRFGAHDEDDRAGDEERHADGPSDLELLVAACRAAFVRAGAPAPRRPWPDPLPGELSLDDPRLGHPTPVAGTVQPVVLGLLDEPDHQRQGPATWDPSAGSLLVHGTVGAGTSTTALTVALAGARAHDADTLQLLALDLDRGRLGVLEALPHCGTVVAARDVERRGRLQAWLLTEATRRRGLGHEELAAEPLLVTVVDGAETWLATLDDPTTYETYEAVTRLLVDAPGLRMPFVLTVTRPNALRAAITSSIEQRLTHRLADPNDHASLGLRVADVPDLGPGRAVRTGDGRLLQVARPDDVAATVAEIAAATPTPRRRPPAVATLPDVLDWPDLDAPLVVDGRRWHVPFGVDATSLEVVRWTLHAGEHALVLGPPGSGRSGLLRGLAAGAATAGVGVVLVGTDGAGGTDARPPFAEVVPPEGFPDALSAAADTGRPTLVLVDDAEHVPDPGPALDGLAAAPNVRVVAAARSDVVQSDYGHWLRRVARSRTGVLLRPSGDVVGDLLGARLPRRAPVAVRPGRGWAVLAGEPGFVQVLGGGADG